MLNMGLVSIVLGVCDMYEQHTLNEVSYRIYGPHIYVYKPDDQSKHNINGYSPTDIPIKLFYWRLADEKETN